ncbi:MAG: acetylxylan esterase [Abitibacteriaceae bacterium]|nr:acetylxylan esterase [Abditibacteriaceae bacterium]
MRKYVIVLAFALLVLSSQTVFAQDAKALTPVPMPWNLAELFKAPPTYPAAGFHEAGVEALFYDGLPFQGRPTRVFAWYGMPAHKPGEKVPGIVLVHGGGGTAFAEWVRLWTSRGYAAIAMDNCGSTPGGKHMDRPRHTHSGPAGWGGFDQIDWPLQDQWTYHAVADVVLANSLLRSMPDVDPQRIGITGISWGGYLTCIVAGVDNRFRFAVPVYGCGFLGEDSTWLPDFKHMGPERAAMWLSLWDPSRYLPHGTMPFLWVDGTNDFAYPLDSVQKSYSLPPGPRTLCTRVRMPHGHGGPGENPAEIHAFADNILEGGTPLAEITAQGHGNEQAWVNYKAASPIAKAEFNYTLDVGLWKDRYWHTIPAQLDTTQSKVSATLPKGVTVFYFNLVDQHGLIVSSEHVELSPHS